VAADPAKTAVIRQRVLRSTASNYAGRFITLGTWFLLTPFILVQLGTTSYGLWVLVSSVVAYSSLLDLGIAGAVIKYTAEYRARGEEEQAHRLVATALCLYAVLGLIAIAISVAIAPIFPSLFNLPPAEHATATWLVLLMGSSVGISIPCTTTTAVLQGLHRHDIVNLISTIGVLLAAVATVAVLLLDGGVVGMVAVSIPIPLIMQVPSIWFINRIAPELQFGWRGAKRSLVHTVFSFSSWLFMGQIAGRLKAKTDEIVIATFLPISAIAPYAIALRLSESAQILTDQFMKILLPLASELHAENDQGRLRSLYITSTRLTLAIFLPVGCTLIVLARPILTLWVGAAYAGFAHLVLILTLANFIDISLWPAGLILQGMSRYRTLAVMSMCTAVANLALSIVLVRRWGLTGVALGTLIPITIECIGFVLPYVMRVLGISLTQALKEMFLPALLPAAPMVVVLHTLQFTVDSSSLLSLMAVIGSGFLVYAIGYLSVGASQFERQAYLNITLSMIRFGKARFKCLYPTPKE
jgi:O-antigen/teichoic acid export membrane protein